MPEALRTDGSSVEDARRVRIDRSETLDRWRYVCPNGHRGWSPTNRHIWCRDCRRASEQGADVDPEHWHVIDKRTGEEIHWSRVELVEPAATPGTGRP